MNSLVKSSCVWSTVDFNSIPICTVKNQTNHTCGASCQKQYKYRLRSFFTFINTVQPKIRQLMFTLDLQEFGPSLNNLFTVCNLEQLQVVRFNVTSLKRDQLSRRQIKKAEPLVKLLVEEAPNIVDMVMPGEVQNMVKLSKLKKLKCLGLMQSLYRFDYNAFDELFGDIPQLERLTLECEGAGIKLQKFHHPSLKYLDISQCKGFYIETMDLPQLKELKISRSPLISGPLVPTRPILPCLKSVLSQGAPSLEYINEYSLKADWQKEKYPEQEKLLKTICLCKTHKDYWQGHM